MTVSLYGAVTNKTREGNFYSNMISYKGKSLFLFSASAFFVENSLSREFSQKQRRNS